MFKYIGIWVLAAASDNILVTPHLEVAVTDNRNAGREWGFGGMLFCDVGGG